jgi:putative ABC transport system substrate-binding protein
VVRQDGDGVRRRDWLAAAAAVAAWPAQAQGVPRLAWIAPASRAHEAPRQAAFRAGLAENGLVDGRDYILELFYAEGDYQRFPALTRQALAVNPAIVLVNTIASVRAAQQATRTVPIIFMATNDPVGAGLIDSLARPGGNTTGVATMADDVAPKLIEMIHVVLPRARRIRALINPQNATNRPIFERFEAAGRTIGLELEAAEVSTPDAVADCLGPPTAPQPDALIVAPDAMFVASAGRIAALALPRGVPVFGSFRDLPAAGALLSYGPSIDSLIKRSAFYVKRVLAGAKPADLPAEQPTLFELAVNLSTAKALGVTLPGNVLALADELIE